MIDLKYLDAAQLAELRAKVERETHRRRGMQIGNVTREEDPTREPEDRPLAVTMRDGVVQDRLVEFPDGRSAWVGQ